jgi:hypothetical protein
MFIGIVSAQSLLQQNQDSRSKAAGSNDNVREQEPSSLSVSCGKTKGNKVEVTFRWQMTGPKPEAMWMGIDKKNDCILKSEGGVMERRSYPCVEPNDTGDLEFKLSNSTCKSGSCKFSKYLVKDAVYDSYAISAMHKTGRKEGRGGSFTCK